MNGNKRSSLFNYNRVVQQGCILSPLLFKLGKRPSRKTTYIQFFKYFLGLNRKVPNVVARNETGRLSLKLNILLRIIKFWILLESLPENNIAKQCLIISNRLANELLLRCFSEDFVSVDPAENVGTIVNALGAKQPLKNLVSINDILSYQSYQNGESVFFLHFKKIGSIGRWETKHFNVLCKTYLSVHSFLIF